MSVTLLSRRLWKVGVQGHLFYVLKELYKDIQTCILDNGSKSRKLSIAESVLQGDVLCTTLFVICFHSLLKQTQKLEKGVCVFVDGARVDHVSITDLAYADDITVVTEDAQRLHAIIKTIRQ